MSVTVHQNNLSGVLSAGNITGQCDITSGCVGFEQIYIAGNITCIALISRFEIGSDGLHSVNVSVIIYFRQRNVIISVGCSFLHYGFSTVHNLIIVTIFLFDNGKFRYFYFFEFGSALQQTIHVNSFCRNINIACRNNGSRTGRTAEFLLLIDIKLIISTVRDFHVQILNREVTLRKHITGVVGYIKCAQNIFNIALQNNIAGIGA